jgi:hypothetical protein
MKNNKIKYLFYSLFALSSITYYSCSDDDASGYSNLEVEKGVTITANIPFASPQNIMETDAVYPFTVTLSKPQSVNVVVKITQTGGDAAEGSDFDFTHEITIPAYSTTGTGSIEIYSDDLAENTESFTLQIGNNLTANASITPINVTFNISNYTEGGLMVDLEWNTNIFDLDGTPIDPTTAADLRLLLTDANYNQTAPIDVADGADFESLMLSPTLPNGVYYLVTDFYDVYASTNGFSVDLTATFNQAGVINDLTYTFPAGLNTKNNCPNNYFKLAKVTKTGTTYVIESSGQSSLTAEGFNGNYAVAVDEWADYSVGDIVPVQYDSALGLYKFKILSTNNPYIDNPTTSYMEVTVNPITSNATVVSNENFLYTGWLSIPVTGTGTVNFCNYSINLVLNFSSSYPNNEFNLIKL